MSDSSPYPKPFLSFMESYVLFVDDFGPSGLKWAQLEKSPGTSGLPDTYKLVNVHGEGPGHFKIYWCQYTKDAVFSVSLANEADLMFTPKMTGCTFAVGMPAPDGNIIAGHANVHDWTNDKIKVVDEEMNDRGTSFTRIMELNAIRLDLVRARQLEMLTEEFNKANDPVAIRKQLNSTNTAYSGASGGIITFGIRDAGAEGNKWRFYFQTKNSGNKVTGVHKIKK